MDTKKLRAARTILPRKTALVAGINHQVSEEVLGLIYEAAEEDDGACKGLEALHLPH